MKRSRDDQYLLAVDPHQVGLYPVRASPLFQHAVYSLTEGLSHGRRGPGQALTLALGAPELGQELMKRPLVIRGL